MDSLFEDRTVKGYVLRRSQAGGVAIDSCCKDSGPIVLSRNITISQMDSFKTE